MNIEKGYQSNRVLKSLTGLSLEEFKELSVIFEGILRSLKKPKKRKRAEGAGRKGRLETVKEKLFFILFYMKVYPTYDLAAFIFDVDKSQPCRWIQKLLPCLEQALGRGCVLPKRKIHSMSEFLEAFSEVKDIFVDGTERRIQRPTSVKNQKRRYSGKKKTHTRKNIILTDEGKRILMVSPTKNGRRHDKHISDQTPWVKAIPPDRTLWLDTGFQGIEELVPTGVSVMRPKKRPKNGTLTPQQKQENQTISSIRIIVENAIAGIKRYNVLTHLFRNRKGQDDSFFLIASALWNFHLQFNR